MNDFDAHAEAVKLGGLANDCMQLYSKQMPVEAMQKEQAILKEAEGFWNDSNKLFSLSKEFEKLNNNPGDLPKVDISLGNGQIYALEFSPRNGSYEDTGVQPELTIDKGDIDQYSHQGIRVVLEDHAYKNTSIIVKSEPPSDCQNQR